MFYLIPVYFNTIRLKIVLVLEILQTSKSEEYTLDVQ